MGDVTISAYITQSIGENSFRGVGGGRKRLFRKVHDRSSE